MSGTHLTVRELNEQHKGHSQSRLPLSARRMWRSMGPLVLLVLCLAIQFGGLTGEGSSFARQTPASASDQESLASITVMTFNLGNGMADPADLVSYIRDTEADLVALLEVTPEIAESVEAELADILPYREIRGDGIPGKALLSRYPITSAEWLEHNPGRPDLLASVDLAGHPVDVLVAHPPPPEISGLVVQPRNGTVEQFDRIIDIASDAEHPFLLLGDLNITEVHQRYDELKSIGLMDVFGAVGSGQGATYPIRTSQFPEVTIPPLVRIDYIWASMEWRAETAIVGDDLGSDHLPVVADLTLMSAVIDDHSSSLWR